MISFVPQSIRIYLARGRFPYSPDRPLVVFAGHGVHGKSGQLVAKKIRLLLRKNNNNLYWRGGSKVLNIAKIRPPPPLPLPLPRYTNRSAGPYTGLKPPENQHLLFTHSICPYFCSFWVSILHLLTSISFNSSLLETSFSYSFFILFSPNYIGWNHPPSRGGGGIFQ